LSNPIKVGASRDAWHAYVDSLSWTCGKLDDSTWRAFLRAGSLGIDPSVAFQTVAERIAAAGDRPRRNKLECQLRRAYKFAAAEAAACHGHIRMPVSRPKLTFDPQLAERFASRTPAIDEKWLAERSPVDVHGLTPERLLSALFTSDERVLIFSRFRSQGQQVWSHGQRLDEFRIGHPHGVWFLSNPVDGEYHPNPRQGYPSRRSEESIVAWRYALLECDQVPAEKWLPIWLRILVQLPLPIVSLVTSGGSSVHALVRVNARCKAHWDWVVRQGLLPRLVPLGADPQALTAVRLTRLPGCRREQTQQEQRLLYFDPNAAVRSILGRIS
jgi:hypothetical protein